MPAGRPTDYCSDLVDEFCSRVASGRSVASVCSDEDMPDHSTVYRWKAQKQEFSDKLAFAREDRKEATRGQMVAWGHDVITDTALDPQRVNAAVNALARAEALMAPKQRLEVTGKDGAALIPESDPTDIARRLAFLLAQGVAQTQK